MSKAPGQGSQHLNDEVEKNAQLLGELGHLVLKQQLLISKAFQGGIEERRKHANAKRLQTRLRSKPAVPDGCKVRMWKQDPSVKSVGVRTVFLPNTVEDGPSDKHIRIRLEGDVKAKEHKLAPLQTDGQGDLMLDFEDNPFAFDLVQVYSVVRMVVNMYQRDLSIDWRWQWDQGKPGSTRTPIDVICHAGVKQNACYLRSKKLMKFYFFHDDDQNKDIFLCRSLDIVAHETGHAVLDALKPDLYYCKKGQEAALHEVFADLTALFLGLSQFDLCEDIVANTKADLRANRYLSGIGEQFGKALEDNTEDPAQKGDAEEPGEGHNSVSRGVRDCNNDKKGSQVREIYDIAGVFTGYMFDILCDVFQHERNPAQRDDAETLYRVARILRRTFLLALYASPKVPNFTDISKAMEAAVDNVSGDDDIDVEFWVACIKNYRLSRELEIAGVEQKEIDPLGGGDY